MNRLIFAVAQGVALAACCLLFAQPANGQSGTRSQPDRLDRAADQNRAAGQNRAAQNRGSNAFRPASQNRTNLSQADNSSPFSFIRDERVGQEIQITNSQLNLVDQFQPICDAACRAQLQDALNTMPRVQQEIFSDMPFDQRMAAQSFLEQDIRESTELAMLGGQILNDNQMERFNELRTQNLGIEGLLSGVTSRNLGVSTDQRASILQIQDIADNAVNACLANPNLTTSQQDARIQQIQNTTINQSINVLNIGQLNLYVGLLGEPFNPDQGGDDQGGDDQGGDGDQPSDDQSGDESDDKPSEDGPGDGEGPRGDRPNADDGPRNPRGDSGDVGNRRGDSGGPGGRAGDGGRPGSSNNNRGGVRSFGNNRGGSGGGVRSFGSSNSRSSGSRGGSSGSNRGGSTRGGSSKSGSSSGRSSGGGRSSSSGGGGRSSSGGGKSSK